MTTGRTGITGTAVEVVEITEEVGVFARIVEEVVGAMAVLSKTMAADEERCILSESVEVY